MINERVADSKRLKELLPEKLEILLITYNRCADLSRTLSSFIDAPFSLCKITVIDNCSTDTTPSVVVHHQSLFPNMVYIKNKYNVGANANIVRAMELSNSLYTWVICDDDVFDFSYCDDVLDCIINEKADLIHVGAHAIEPWHGGFYEKPQALMGKGYHYFAYSSFLPSSIFRTSLFVNKLEASYGNIQNMYPHMPYLLSFFASNNLMYLAKNRIVTCNIVQRGYTNRDWIYGWLNTCLLLPKPYQSTAFWDGFIALDKGKAMKNFILHTVSGEVFWKAYFTILITFPRDFIKLTFWVLIKAPGAFTAKAKKSRTQK